MNRARLAMVSVVTVLAAALAMGGSATAAQASPTEILVSADGVSFGTHFGTPLFAGIGKLVPQDVVTVSFWVRNPTTSVANMRVSVSHLVSPSMEMASNLMLTAVDVSMGATESSAIADLSTCDVVVAPRPLAGGATMRVDLTLEMMDVTGQVAQAKLGDLDFLVGMRDTQAGAFPASACDDVGVAIPGIPPTAPSGNNPGGLIKTGVDLPYDWFAIAAGLFGFGFLLLLRRRRERREES
ncbi:hypothetical protein EYE40_01750 [Glaciihabitans arcticus]|uniref:LPXTG cell wall anchor domain-containing protein n=1 Tax=Glaciihabitans arcticus TaxID=2668039 RepID=A0A4V2JEM8_9MICO|nr:hypothetical protein [Glaciihabitans arcticus]TBN56219.1 hypothetical protein EYE40_01750 [Glaciihabitans arcticus]